MPWLRATVTVLTLVFVLAWGTGEAQARRVALVVGNAAYTEAPVLANPANDARDVAKALRGLGFEVVLGTNLDKAGMEATLRKFASTVQGADTALFFYAGHGLAVGDQNYLIPTDAKLEHSTDLDFETVPLDLVMRVLSSEPRTSLVFLDACRDNPLARSLARSLGGSRSLGVQSGLASVNAATGTLIAYSTQPGNVARDGTGRNSPFTTSLLRHIDDPVEIRSMLTRVRRDVLSVTKGAQEPWDNSSLTAEVYLAEPPAPTGPQTATTAPDTTRDEAFWRGIAGSDNPDDFRIYLKQFPNGVFVPLAKQRLASLQARPVAAASSTAIAALPPSEMDRTSLPEASAPVKPPPTPPAPIVTAQAEVAHVPPPALAGDALLQRGSPIRLAASNGFGRCGTGHRDLSGWHRISPAAAPSRVPSLAGAQPGEIWAADTSGIEGLARTFADGGAVAAVAFAQVQEFNSFDGDLSLNSPELCIDGSNSLNAWNYLDAHGPRRIDSGWKSRRGFNFTYVLETVSASDGQHGCIAFEGTRARWWLGGFWCGAPGASLDRATVIGVLDRIQVPGLLG